MADGDLAPLTRAVQARMDGQEPLPEDIEICKKHLFRLPNLLCWNGQRSDRPQCGPQGSQNIPFYAEAGVGNFKWIADNCRVEAEEGNFGKENGSPASFYYSGVIGCKLLAYRELSKMGKKADAEAVRLAVRSNVAWDAMSSFPTPRLHDEVDEAGEIIKADAKRPKRDITVAVAGMRWSTKGRAAMTSEDAHSEVLASALKGEFACLMDQEVELLKRTVKGDVQAAREVATWMFGTIDTPEPNAVVWKWRLRRTTQGAESVFLGKFPNPMKPMRVVTSIDREGNWLGMRPSPHKMIGGWAREFKVGIENGVIKASCIAGSAEQNELGGDVVWEVMVEGKDVKFSGRSIGPVEPTP